MPFNKVILSVQSRAHTQHATLKNRRSQCGVVLDTILIQPLHEAVSSSFSEARAGSEGPSSWFPTLFYLEISCNF